MGFDKILELWERDPEERDKVAPAREVVASLRACFPDVCLRIESDLVVLHHLEDLVRQLMRVSWRDPDVLKNKLEGFCRAYQGKGERRPDVREMNLGHVEQRTKFQDYLENNSRSAFVRGGKFSAAPSVAALLASTLEDQRSKLDRLPLSRFQMWSFYQPGSPDEPYMDIETSQVELRRRLGLGQIPASEQLLFWAHKLEGWQTPTVPTVFDAELNEWFRLGGRTQPLSGHDGLWEVVHEPVSGQQLTRAITSAR